MRKYLLKKIIFNKKHVLFCVLFFSLFLGICKSVNATVVNLGVTYFGDNSATSQGVVRFKNLTTSPATWGAQTNTSAASTNSFTTWIVAKTSPVRDEIMVGALRINGTLDIQTCTNAGTCTARWNNPGTQAGTPLCTTTATAGTCVQPFDIDYEALKGRGIVVYGDTTAGKVYYALWDGSAWSPNSTPGTPGVSNEMALSGSTKIPRWVRVVSSGENLADDRSNRVIILVGSSVNVNDAAYTLDAFYWDGTTMSSATNLSTTLGLCASGRCFDGNWQGVNTFVVSYTNNGVAEMRYRKYIVGTGWGADTQAYLTSTTPIFVESAADLTSSKIMVSTADSGNDTQTAVWRGDDTTDGWTLCNGTCPDTAIETVGGNQSYTAFGRFNGSALHVYNDAGTTGDSTYWTYTPPSTWGTKTTTGLTTTDDSLNTKVVGSPNSSNIMMLNEDVDCRLRLKMWTGSAWDTSTTEMNNSTTATLTNYGVTCPLSTSPGVAPIGIPYDYDFVWKIYSPWQRNWEFFSGSDTASSPSTSLAAQDTAPTGISNAAIVRLRVNYSETGTMSQIDARKKLQYTTGCNPNSVLESTCTWTNVDEAAGTGIWRYADLTCTTTDCADGVLLTATKLTGSGACTQGNGCGTWIESGTAAAASTMDHNGSQVQENEYILQNNGAAASATYYFRLYDNNQLTPVYTWQSSSNCNAGSSQCTYPNLTTAAAVSPTVTTNFASSPTYSAANLVGSITNNGGADATQSGFAWGTVSTLSGGDTATTTLGAFTGIGPFSGTVGSLNQTTVYYFRAYATNSGGTGYGSILSFTTGNSTPSRKMRLFEGFKIKFVSGKIILRQN